MTTFHIGISGVPPWKYKNYLLKTTRLTTEPSIVHKILPVDSLMICIIFLLDVLDELILLKVQNERYLYLSRDNCRSQWAKWNNFIWDHIVRKIDFTNVYKLMNAYQNLPSVLLLRYKAFYKDVLKRLWKRIRKDIALDCYCIIKMNYWF